MPTILQLPSASSVSAADDVLISQGGTARTTSIGLLLGSTQPAIIVDSQSLIGRTSLGTGGPEEIDVGLGMTLSGGTLVADGLDHAAFAMTSSLSVGSDLVISNQGSPMLMQASLLRGLFSAGQNVAIDPNGVISTTAVATSIGNLGSGSSIGELQVVTALAAQDLVAVNHAGTNSAIAYSNFLGGVTIDEAQAAGPAGDSDTIWAAQGSNVMSSQTFAAIWVWMATKLPTYKAPVVEISTSINLDTTVHNGRILICSQPVTLTPLTNNLGSGFQCTVINASSGNITLGTGFISSSGSFVLTPWQSAALSCAKYSGGTIAFAAMPATATIASVPGQVSSLSSSAATSTTITVLWQAPVTGGTASSYTVQIRLTGTTSWSSVAPVVTATTYQFTALQPATSYDIAVQAENASGPGVASTTLTVATPSAAPALSIPGQVTGLSSSAATSSTVTLLWQAPSAGGTVSSYTVMFRVTGTSSWSSSNPVSGVTTYQLTALQSSTSYDIAVQAHNATGAGAASATLTVVTPSIQLTSPMQVTGLTASAISGYTIQLTWVAQSGTAAAATFTVQYRVTGSATWSSPVAGITGSGATISGLLSATSYDFEVTGVNATGGGPASSTVTAVTLAASQSVTSIAWSLAPSGTYTAGSGSIGVNAHVTPTGSPIQFGFSLAASTPPTNWTVATLINTNFWGAYAPTPPTAGTWYAWAEGLDGSAPTLGPSTFVVQ